MVDLDLNVDEIEKIDNEYSALQVETIPSPQKKIDPRSNQASAIYFNGNQSLNGKSFRGE